VAWYTRRLAAHLDQRPFSEKQPAKDWDERFERVKQSMKGLINKTETKIMTAAPAKRKESESTAESVSAEKDQEAKASTE
jgi:hypothetical protein